MLSCNHTLCIILYMMRCRIMFYYFFFFVPISLQFVNNVGKVRVSDELQSVKPEVAKLKKSGVDAVIALGHSGLEMDRRVAAEVNGIDAVVGGHSHSYLCNGEWEK